MEAVEKINGKKFMWDGYDYPEKKNALEAAQKYKNDGFETEVIEKENKFFVFTRRVVKEVVIEGSPAI
ncbi:MAG: hypothetical protein M1308_19325 [Actinobacteria bacterium]|nr:hypothetical protein [Actinomycetota bacterium]